jgi:hypothetical protein
MSDSFDGDIAASECVVQRSHHVTILTHALLHWGVERRYCEDGDQGGPVGFADFWNDQVQLCLPPRILTS